MEILILGSCPKNCNSSLPFNGNFFLHLTDACEMMIRITKLGHPPKIAHFSFASIFFSSLFLFEDVSISERCKKLNFWLERRERFFFLLVGRHWRPPLAHATEFWVGGGERHVAKLVCGKGKYSRQVSWFGDPKNGPRRGWDVNQKLPRR